MYVIHHKAGKLKNVQDIAYQIMWLYSLNGIYIEVNILVLPQSVSNKMELLALPRITAF